MRFLRAAAGCFLLLGCGLEVDPEPYAVGDLVRGTLDDTDFELNDGSVADGYGLWLEAGEEVTIVVRGVGLRRIDPYVFVFYEDTRAEITHDDDSASGFNSRILLTAERSVSHVVVITTYETGFHSGEYELQSWPGLHPTAN